MLSVDNLPFVVQLLFFTFFSFFALFTPGNAIVSRLSAGNIVKITLSLILGISLWGIQGFIFGLLGVRDLTYLYLIVFNLLWFYHAYKNFKLPIKIPKFKLEKIDYLIILTLLIGISLQLFSVILNFIPYQGGLFFNSGIPDNLYHAGVTKELIKNIPPLEPGVYDSTIYNYHYLSNLISAEYSRIFKLNIIYVDFHFFPILLTILFGFAIYSFGKTLNIGKKYIFLLLLVIYFIGDLLPYLYLILNGSLKFNYSTLDNPMSLWVSFSRYTGLVLFFGGITSLTIFFKNKSKISALIFTLILGSIIGFKVYIGLIGLIGLFFIGIYYLLIRKYKLTIPLIFTAVLSLILYLPVNKGAGGLVFTGLWRFEDFIAQPLWGLDDYELARRIHVENKNYLKVILYSITYIFIYIFFSVGFLLLGFFNTRKTLSSFPKELNIFLISGLLITTILGLLFIQTSGGANSSQFLISIYITGSIYTALALNRLNSKTNKIILMFIIIFFLLSTMRVFGQSYLLLDRIYSNNGFIINARYLDAINYTSKNISKDKLFLIDPNIGSRCIMVNLIDTKRLYYCDAASPGDKGVINDIHKKKELIKNTFYGTRPNQIIFNLKAEDINFIIATKGAALNFLKDEYSNTEYVIKKVED
jgi:hypothetical protein